MLNLHKNFVLLYGISIFIYNVNACEITDNLNTTTSNCRYKRHLVFPKKSALVVTLVLLKSTIVHRTLNTLHEIDFPFPLPQTYRLAHRDRRMIHQHFEDALTLFGLNGASCIKRAICETKNSELIKSDKEDLIQELLQVIFGNISNSKEKCENIEDACPFSVIDLLHFWSHDFIKRLEEYNKL